MRTGAIVQDEVDPGSPPIWNRWARIERRNGSAEPGFAVLAPVRGEGMRRAVVERRAAPVAHELLARVYGEDGARRLSLDAHQADELGKLGLLVSPDRVARAVRFDCTLADHAPPEAGSEQVDEALRPTPTCCLLAPGESPDPDLPPPPLVPADGHSVGWVRDPLRDVWRCCSLNHDEAAAVCALGRDGDGLTPALRAALRRADILVGESAIAQRRGFDEGVAAAAHALRTGGHGVVRELIPRPLLRALGRYYRALAEEGWLIPGRDRQPYRFFAHNEPVARWLHAVFAGLLARVIAEPVKRSYAFVALYGGGDELGRHVDREQCEYTVSVAIDDDADDPWPLYLEPRPEDPVDVRLRPGDGVVFRGREVPHYRTPLAAGRAVTAMLWHFVPRDFDGPLE